MQAGLGRLVGLGLGLLSREQLLSCPINVVKSEDSLYKQSTGVAIEQLIVGKVSSNQKSLARAALAESDDSISYSQTSFGSASLPAQQTSDDIQAVNVTDITNQINLSSPSDAGSEQMIIVDEELKEEVSLELKEEEEWPTIVDEELKEEVSLELKEEEEEEWPTIVDEELKVDQKKIRQDEKTQELESTLAVPEEQPIADESAVLSIPGLTSTTSLPAKSGTSKQPESLKDSSTLGKLKFADSDDFD